MHVDGVKKAPKTLNIIYWQCRAAPALYISSREKTDTTKLDVINVFVLNRS